MNRWHDVDYQRSEPKVFRERCVLRQAIQILTLMVALSTGLSVRAAEFPEGALVDGAVAREWGDFIRAKDIRISCRPVRSIVRPVPRPEDSVTRCDLRTEFDHPYAAFSDEQLKQIAGYDWEAAYLLAYRLLMQPAPGKTKVEDLEIGLSYAMNALVHTGEKQVFELMIHGRHFRNWSVWSTASGIPNDRELREKEEEYVWYKAGYNLGFIEEDDYQWTRLLRVMQRFENYFDINELNTRAAEISDGVTKRRATITGE